jgi:hypothetical protein
MAFQGFDSFFVSGAAIRFWFRELRLSSRLLPVRSFRGWSWVARAIRPRRADAKLAPDLATGDLSLGPRRPLRNGGAWRLRLLPLRCDSFRSGVYPMWSLRGVFGQPLFACSTIGGSAPHGLALPVRVDEASSSPSLRFGSGGGFGCLGLRMQAGRAACHYFFRAVRVPATQALASSGHRSGGRA